MIEFMTGYQALVLPSLYEGLSNTLLEAGAASLACIASSYGGNPEVIEHGVSGVLVDPFNIADVASAIELLKDEEKRLQLAKRHRENVLQNFSLDSSIQQTMSVLESA
jgi:glycosyltransferase involved in cell wall biosynthesis